MAENEEEFRDEDEEEDRSLELEEELPSEKLLGVELVSELSNEDEERWIDNFVNMRGNEFFCEVDEEFIQDDFNLTGLSDTIPYYDEALDTILDMDELEDTRPTDLQDLVDASAEVLYGLIHARFILSNRGLMKMYEKYVRGDFGRCPRVSCQGQHVLPVGMTNIVQACSVNIFCPRCHEVYFPRSSKHGYLDGCYFGTTFAHLFLLQFPDLIPKYLDIKYTPKIYGFKINPDSPYYKLRLPEDKLQQQSNNQSSNDAKNRSVTGKNG